MTPDRTRVNFSGSRIDSYTGRTRPMPSNAKTAVLRARAQGETDRCELPLIPFFKAPLRR